MQIVGRSSDGLSVYHTIPNSTTFKKRPSENIVGKGENTDNQHFFLYPQYFLPSLEEISSFQSHLFCRPQMLSVSTSIKFCRFGKS